MSDSYRIVRKPGGEFVVEAPTAEEAVRLYDLFFDDGGSADTDAQKRLHDELRRLAERVPQYNGDGTV